ncbi:MAG: hypothetical protein K2Y32_14875 [Candidatus Obscuribacterales bacterium]|nr:hypothetical protein [Candidatus Obscuribacterales bacterium]
MALRSIVKHSYIRASRDGKARAKAHVNYIKFRPGKDKEEQGKRSFFTDKEDGLTSRPVHEAIERQAGTGVLVHKMIVSPGVQHANTQEYVREVMHELGRQKGLELEWYAVEHRNTANPHAHVVIMSKDKNGRQVKLSKDDYTKLKETGDKYLERNKLLDKEKLKEKSKRPLGAKLKEAMKAAKSEFLRVMKEDEDERKLTRFEAMKEQEADSLGDRPDYEQLAAKRLAKEEKLAIQKAEAWEYYSKSITVEMAGEAVEYSWNMEIGRLRELERLAEAGGLLSQEDQEKLKTWIKDSYYEEKYFERKSKQVEKIEAGEYGVFGKESSLQELSQVNEAHQAGSIVLSKAEEKALKSWLQEKEKQEPIRVMLDGEREPILYDRQDSCESLEFLASEYRKGEDWAREAITKAEYKKLKQWIAEKREMDKALSKEALKEDHGI